MNRTLEVQLGSRSYPIITSRGLDALIKADLASLQQAQRPVAIITDCRVREAQGSFFEHCFSDLPCFAIPEGEAFKRMEFVEGALEFLAEQGLDRSACILAFGGGVVGDLAGYVAASYMRGIDFIQIPTTLLAMVDSSVGGKTGINLKAGKNLAGAFHQPRKVWIDLARLDTLDARQFASGMAEVIKAGMLADVRLFEQLERLPRLNSHDDALAEIVEMACQIKADVVAGDERESASKGGRALLNLGHTFGHAIEQCTAYQVYLHGEAISIGLAMASDLSRRLGFINTEELERVTQLLQKYELPVRLKEPLSVEKLLLAMSRDKKKSFGTLKYVILEQLGAAATLSGIETSLIGSVLKEWGAQ